jgi:hypothetical protein
VKVLVSKRLIALVMTAVAAGSARPPGRRGKVSTLRVSEHCTRAGIQTGEFKMQEPGTLRRVIVRAFGGPEGSKLEL